MAVASLTALVALASLAFTFLNRYHPVQPGFEMEVRPKEVSIARGRSRTIRIRIEPTGGYAGNPHLGVEGPIDGVTFTAEGGGDGDPLQLRIEAASDAALGNHNVIVTATDGHEMRTQPLLVGITVDLATQGPDATIDNQRICAPTSDPGQGP